MMSYDKLAEKIYEASRFIKSYCPLENGVMRGNVNKDDKFESTTLRHRDGRKGTKFRFQFLKGGFKHGRTF